MTSEVSTEFGGRRANLPPLTFELPPAADIAKAKLRRSRWGPVFGLALYALAGALALQNDLFRRVEMHISGPLAGLCIGGHRVVIEQTAALFNLASPRGFGLNLSSECTSALLLIPLFVMMGSFAIFTSLSLRRQMLAAACGAVLIVAVNTLRIAGIAWATWNFGVSGYDYSHVFVGSAFSLVGFVAAMLIALWILVRTDRMKQAAVAIKRGFWVATAPAVHRFAGGVRGSSRNRAPAAHRYRGR